VGFDWPDAKGPREKIEEELRELDEAWAGDDRAAMQHELGDLLQAVVNLGRKLGLDPEQALRDSTDRFARRFRHIELALEAQGRAVSDADAAEQDRLWNEAKERETKPSP
jgi:uncharacterized protein YabN with tetrapyrrole methylase and pyrophosphatase domain